MPSGLVPGTLLWTYFWAFLGQEVPYQGGTWYDTSAKPKRHVWKAPTKIFPENSDCNFQRVYDSSFLQDLKYEELAPYDHPFLILGISFFAFIFWGPAPLRDVGKGGLEKGGPLHGGFGSLQ